MKTPTYFHHSSRPFIDYFPAGDGPMCHSLVNGSRINEAAWEAGKANYGKKYTMLYPIIE
jgi:hypothetical protein